MRRSLRRQLIATYSIISLCMAMFFGGTTYFYVKHTTFASVDARLRDHAQALAAVIVESGDNTLALELSEIQLDLFQRDYQGSLYYKIWDSSNEVVDSSIPDSNIPDMDANIARTRHAFREVTITGPANSRILVGRSVVEEQQQLKLLAVTSTIVGLAVVGTMQIAGWYLSGRALSPIARISEAAASISESNLSQRIDVNALESELSGLAETINNAFDRLQVSFERQIRFTSDASHELRTPLSIIIVHADRALKAERDPLEYQEVLGSIKQSALRMKSVVNGLLTLAKNDPTNLALEKNVVDLGSVVSGILKRHESIAIDKGIRLVQETDSVKVLGNDSLLEEAVENLISNALKFTQRGDHVFLQVMVKNSDAVIVVKDTGPGISPSVQPFVFDRFYRADTVRNSCGSNGVGLGLSIAKSIVELHGGAIELESKLGVGTTFTVRLLNHIAQTD